MLLDRVRIGKYYVYEHWRPDLNIPFYVGKGKAALARELRKREAKVTQPPVGDATMSNVSA